MLYKLTNLFIDSDATLAEINPLIITTDYKAIAADAKIIIDDAALYRHPEFNSFALNEYAHELERKATDEGLTFVVLDGDIGVLGGGAGLCMAMIDILKDQGGNPANFVDMGGGISADDITLTLNLILDMPDIKGIVVFE